MAVLKEYVVKIKWEHDRGTKTKAIKELQKTFADLKKDIDKTTASLKNFHKIGLSLPKMRSSSMSSIPIHQIQRAKSSFHHLPMPQMQPQHEGAKDTAQEVEKKTRGGNLKSALFAAFEVGLIVVAINKVKDAVDKMSDRMLSTQSFSVTGGFGKDADFFQRLGKNTGINFGAFGGLYSASIGASHMIPSDITTINRAYNREIQAHSKGSVAIANYIQSHGYRGDLGARGLLGEVLATGARGRDLRNDLRGLGLSDKDAANFAQYRDQIAQAYRTAPQVDTTGAAKAAFDMNASFARLGTTIDRQLTPEFIRMAKVIEKFTNYLNGWLGGKYDKSGRVAGTIMDPLGHSPGPGIKDVLSSRKNFENWAHHEWDELWGIKTGAPNNAQTQSSANSKAMTHHSFATMENAVT